MKEVELRLTAPNADAVKSIRQVAIESKKLYDEQEKRIKDNIGLIGREINIQKVLEEKRNAAMNTKQLEGYNKALEASRKRLDEFQNAGIKAEVQVESMSQKIGKWVLGLGLATTALNVVKEAVLATTTGMNAFNIVGAAAKQVMYNLVTGATNLSNGLAQVIKAQKELNALRLQEKIDTYESLDLKIKYNKLLNDANNHTKSNTERLDAYNAALKTHNQIIDSDIKLIERRRNAIASLLIVQGDNEKLQMEFIDLSTKLKEAENSRYEGINRIISSQSNLINQIWQDKLDAWHKEIELDNEKWEKEKKNAETKKDLQNEITLYTLDGLDQQLKAAEQAYEKDMEAYKDNAEIKLLLTQRYGLQIIEIQKQFLEKAKKDNEKYGEMIFFNPLPSAGTGTDKLYDSNYEENTEEFKKNQKKKTDAEIDEQERRNEAIKKGLSEMYNFTKDIIDREAEDAQRRRELLDQRVSELQQELETETRLYEAGYASNVAAKKKELAEIKKQREKALKEEEEALQKQRTMDSIAQGINIFTASTNILKEFTKLGPIGLILASAAIATMFTLISSTKKKSQEAVMLAEGGHGMVRGRLHSEGGEPFLNHVEVEDGERWGVLSRRASRKYGKVFGQMVDGFNKDKLPVPKTGININNITVENTGPNQRLDQINKNLKGLRAGEEVIHAGNAIIIRKGSTTRTVRL